MILTEFIFSFLHLLGQDASFQNYDQGKFAASLLHLHVGSMFLSNLQLQEKKVRLPKHLKVFLLSRKACKMSCKTHILWVTKVLAMPKTHPPKTPNITTPPTPLWSHLWLKLVAKAFKLRKCPMKSFHYFLFSKSSASGFCVPMICILHFSDATILSTPGWIMLKVSVRKVSFLSFCVVQFILRDLQKCSGNF